MSCAATQCSNQGVLRCSRCQQTLYCSKECQTKDWILHKLHCSTPQITTCFYCQSSATNALQQCGECKQSLYCSKKCQKLALPQHKLTCLRPEVKLLESLNPHLIISILATRFANRKLNQEAYYGAEIIIINPKIFAVSLDLNEILDSSLEDILKITFLTEEETKLAIKTANFANNNQEKGANLIFDRGRFMIMCIYKRSWIVSHISRSLLERATGISKIIEIELKEHQL